MKHEKLLNFRIDVASKQEFLDKAKSFWLEKKFCHILTINPEIIMAAQKNQELSQIINDANIIIPEAAGIELAFKLKGKKIKKLPGIEFSEGLLNLANKNSFKVAFVGSNEAVLREMIQNVSKQYPNINIVYKQNGFYEDEDLVIENLKKAEPEVVFVALGSPKQDYFIKRSKNILNHSIMIGVGGSFDVWAKEVKRAPKFFQKTGLEWFYRLITQPSRFKRMFPTLPLFLIKSIVSK